MEYRKPELVRLNDAINVIRQSISKKPTNVTADLNPGYSEKTTVNAYEADE